MTRAGPRARHTRDEEAAAVKLAVIAALLMSEAGDPDMVAPLNRALSGSVFFAREARIADEIKEPLFVVFPASIFPAEPLS